MNIEESIEILESYKESLEEYEDNPRIIQAIETLLTAYEKEKGLSEDEKTFIQLGEIIGEKNVKDKIKAKIEEVEQCELYNMKIPKLNTLDERLGAKIGIKYVLQLLLKEE